MGEDIVLKKGGILGPGVWGQRFGAKAIDPIMRENNRFGHFSSDKKFLEELRLLYWFDPIFQDHQALVSGELPYAAIEKQGRDRKIFYDWNNVEEGSEVVPLSKENLELNAEEELLAKSIGLKTQEEKAILKTVKDLDFLIMAPASPFFNTYLDPLTKIFESREMRDQRPIIMTLTKALYAGDEKLPKVTVPYQLLEERLGEDRIITADGPNISKQVENYDPGSIIFASRSKEREFLDEVAKYFHGFHFSVQTSNAPVAVSYAAAVKNMAAVAVALARGYEKEYLKAIGSSDPVEAHMTNLYGTLSSLAQKDALDTYTFLAKKFRNNWDKVHPVQFQNSSASIGDMITTMISPESRNGQWGEGYYDELSKLDDVDPEIKKQVGDEVEKVINQAVESRPTMATMKKLYERYPAMPGVMYRAVLESVFGNTHPRDVIRQLLKYSGPEMERLRKAHIFYKL